MNTGRPVPTDWLGSGENVRGKDMTSLHQPAETFVGAMVLDGVFERHRALRGGVIELGAGWVPSMIKRLDWIAEIWSKSEPELEGARRAVGDRSSSTCVHAVSVRGRRRADRASDGRLYLFSSDYPHAEGGRHPLGRFAQSLAGAPRATLARFYSGNFATLFGIAAAA